LSEANLDGSLAGNRAGLFAVWQPLSRIMMISVVIVRVFADDPVTARRLDLGDLGWPWPQLAAPGLLDAPPEAGHDNRDWGRADENDEHHF